MDLLRFLLCAAGILLLFPWVRCFFRRAVMAVRLRRRARANGWTFTPARPLWFLAANSGTSPDCFLEGEAAGKKRIYSVKLWASLRRMQNVYFIGADPGTVRTRRVVPLAGRFASKFDSDLEEIVEGTGGGINLILESREKRRDPVDYWTRAGGGPYVIPVLLFCPAPLNVMESRVVPLSHSTVERLPMFTKAAETTLATRRLFDGDLLHGREYIFGTEAFCSELAHPHVGL